MNNVIVGTDMYIPKTAAVNIMNTTNTYSIHRGRFHHSGKTCTYNI